MRPEEIITNPSQIQTYIDRYVGILIDYSPKLVGAFIILFGGLYVIKLLNNLAHKIMTRKGFEPTLSNFLADIMIWVLRVLLFVTTINTLGIETTAFAAILGAAGLAIGLSLQGSLSNFAGGMLIVLFKPFKVGDTIEAQGVVGTVSEIQIFVSKLITANNHTIFVPNGALSNGTITNYSAQGTRRADLIFSVSYATDLKVAKEIILKVLKDNPKVLTNPEPIVIVSELTDSAVKLAIRPWCNVADFAMVCAETLEGCRTALTQSGIETQPFVKEHTSRE